jgi:hypothetical protein
MAQRNPDSLPVSTGVCPNRRRQNEVFACMRAADKVVLDRMCDVLSNPVRPESLAGLSMWCLECTTPTGFQHSDSLGLDTLSHVEDRSVPGQDLTCYAEVDERIVRSPSMVKIPGPAAGQRDLPRGVWSADAAGTHPAVQGDFREPQFARAGRDSRRSTLCRRSLSMGLKIPSALVAPSDKSSLVVCRDQWCAAASSALASENQSAIPSSSRRVIASDNSMCASSARPMRRYSLPRPR